ncbi:MAG: glycosyltransferase [Lachnospiraceae bacterium]|nr:glycosyltransferase [Lachnospiraceae bacterium]
MNILLMDTGSYTLPDLMAKLAGMGHKCRVLTYSYNREDWELKYHNDEFEGKLCAELSSKPDAVMTTNFYPLVARVCHEKDIKYISWSYDSPMNLPLIEEMDHPTNYVFLFDKKDVQKYLDLGLEHFYHLPLAVNCDRLDRIASEERFVTDVSFVGQLYNSTLPMLRGIMAPEHRELVDKMVQTQLRIYGNWFVGDMLTDGIIEAINAHFRSLGQDSVQITKDQLAYSVAQQITYMERLSLLKLLSISGIRTDLYSNPLSDEEKALLDKVNVHGRVSYDKEMPALFKSSRINLNPSLKIIQSGIPLRALDIMGSGGFLLTNFQPEIDEYFENGSEVVMYKSIEEAADKAKYYLSHEDERIKTAHRGYEKVRRDFSYEKRIEEMFKTAGLQ